MYEYVSNQCSSTKELKDSTIKTKEMKLLAIKINQLSPIKGDTKSDIEFKNYTKQKKSFQVNETKSIINMRIDASKFNCFYPELAKRESCLFRKKQP